jgi:hypothetical protein
MTSLDIDVNLYLKSNIKPEYIGRKHRLPHNIDNLSDLSLYSPEKINLPELSNSIQKCNVLLNDLTNMSSDENIDTCPVCFSELGDTNVVISACNHKTCVSCFATNLLHNKNSGDCCVLCRANVCR